MQLLHMYILCVISILCDKRDVKLVISYSKLKTQIMQIIGAKMQLYLVIFKMGEHVIHNVNRTMQDLL